MLLSAPPEPPSLTLALAEWYAVDPRLFDEMTDLTLQHAWRAVQLHEMWGATNKAG